MKIAVTAENESTEGMVDPRFGRAKCFLVYDEDKKAWETIDNKQNLESAQGAGIQTGRNIANLGVEAVITGNVGPNAFRTLNAAGIRVFLADKQTVQEAIDSFKARKLKEANKANVEGHWV